MRQLVLDLPDHTEATLVLSALDAYKARLRLSIAACKETLAEFEGKYRMSTDRFLRQMAAEDLEGGDTEYVEWAGEAKILSRLETELLGLEGIRCELP
ncbi:MAG: hypothetical protein FJ279_04185 [Planctomycetes bacterium]|nr:hypothetical protein [Planctomycetota bacterium]MBM4079125.1 hypothetical protein [Planctomycetota bacterium]MBM4087357.1 hypothetical protein [Planctomycetota bacterium]